jgi:hypothetical protein
MKQDRNKIDVRSSIEIAQALLKKMQAYESAIKAKPIKSRAEKRHVTFLGSLLKSNSTK